MEFKQRWLASSRRRKSVTIGTVVIAVAAVGGVGRPSSAPTDPSTLPARTPVVVAQAETITPTPVLITAAPQLSTAAPVITEAPSPIATTPGPTPSPTLAPTPPPQPSQAPTPTPQPAQSPTPTAAQRFGFAPIAPTEEGQVVRVTDGDTIRVLIGGLEYPVRYIGIDTPETVDPNSPVEWMGPAASRANERLVEGRTVILEKDVSQTDFYGRLLRYVWVIDGNGWLMVNAELVRRGFAQVSTYPPDVMYADMFLEAQRAARRAGLGLWSDPPEADPTPRPKPDPTPKPTREPRPDRNCDSSYPDVCIPLYPPDLDCGQIAFQDFRVRGPDRHGFDGDNDGIGCES